MAWGSIGSFAGLVFTVSSWRVLTPDNISGSTSSNWATHSVIGGKDKSEYVSPGLREYQFNITLSSRLGVNPRKVFDALMDLCEAGAVDYFIINNRPVSQNAHAANNVNFQTDYDKRVEKIGAVVDGCSLLLEYLTICTEEGIISAKKAGIWTKKVTDVKYPAMKWLTSERGRAEKLRAEAERKRLTEQAAALKAVLYPEP